MIFNFAKVLYFQQILNVWLMMYYCKDILMYYSIHNQWWFYWQFEVLLPTVGYLDFFYLASIVIIEGEATKCSKNYIKWNRESYHIKFDFRRISKQSSRLFEDSFNPFLIVGGSKRQFYNLKFEVCMINRNTDRVLTYDL